jgi:Flp pilus assembly protein protease CpaA
MTAVLCYGVFVGLASVISIEDWRTRKIRNRLIVAGLLVCAAGLLLLLVNSLLGAGRLRFGPLGEYYLPLRFYPRLALHFVLSLAAGIGFWRYAIWPAGDAKFFALSALFAALIDPNLPGFPLLLFLILLINIFVPAGIVFALETIVNLVLRIPRLRGVDWPKWRKAKAEMVVIRARELWPYRGDYLILAVNLFALFFALQTASSRVRPYMPEPWGSLCVFVLMFVFWDGLVIVLRNKRVGAAAFAGLSIAALVGVFGLRLDVGRGFLAAVRMTFNFGMLLSVGRLVFAWIIERDSLRELRVEDLKYGDILSDKTWERIGAEKDLAGKMDERYVDGLSHGDTAALKAWLAGRAAADYNVYHTIPFALWIFLGTLLTLSYRGSVVAALAPHLSRAQGLLSSGGAR